MFKILPLLIFLLISNNVFASRARTLRCYDKKEKGIVSLLDHTKTNWRSVEELWKREGGIKKPRCLKRRFKRNGVVVCHKKNFVEPQYYRCMDSSGWANFGGLRAHICPSFFDHFETLKDHNKRACLSGLLFRLYGENCYKRSRFPDTFMSLVEFGFKWYAENNPVTIDFRDCKFQ